MASKLTGFESDQPKVAKVDLLDQHKMDQQLDMLQGLAGLTLGREVGREVVREVGREPGVEQTGLALGRMEVKGEGSSVNVTGWEQKAGQLRVGKELVQGPSLHRVRRELCGQCGLEVGLKSHISRYVAACRSRS